MRIWKAIKDSKWYWWIPIVWIICIPQMSKWTFQPENEIERGWRYILITYLMFPSVLALVFIFMYLNGLLK